MDGPNTPKDNWVMQEGTGPEVPNNTPEGTGQETPEIKAKRVAEAAAGKLDKISNLAVNEPTLNDVAKDHDETVKYVIAIDKAWPGDNSVRHVVSNIIKLSQKKDRPVETILGELQKLNLVVSHRANARKVERDALAKREAAKAAAEPNWKNLTDQFLNEKSQTIGQATIFLRKAMERYKDHPEFVENAQLAIDTLIEGESKEFDANEDRETILTDTRMDILSDIFQQIKEIESAAKEEPEENGPPAVAEAKADKGKAGKGKFGQAVPVKTKEKRKLSDKDRVAATERYLTGSLKGKVTKYSLKQSLLIDLDGNPKEAVDAIKRFQKQYGIPQDGIFGPKSLKAFNEVSRKAGFKRPTAEGLVAVSLNEEAPKPVETVAVAEPAPEEPAIEKLQIFTIRIPATDSSQPKLIKNGDLVQVVENTENGISVIENADGKRINVLTEHIDWANHPSETEKQHYVGYREVAYQKEKQAYAARQAKPKETGV